MKKLIGWIVLLVLVGAAYSAYHFRSLILPDTNKLVFTTHTLQKRDLRSSISATGTLEPEELVNVGAQVGGMITHFGQDADGNTVDYRSPVKAGMLLAEIDDVLYTADLESSKAQQLQALAQIASAEANIKLSAAKYELAKADWDRAQQLRPNNIIAKSEYDAAQAAFAQADAERLVAAASLKQANAQYASSNVSITKSERNLSYCTIKSPVDGIIIDRRVNIGQTVNASMNAPSLFLIAKDLKQMQVWVSVNEADIGEISPGQKVIFTVDAFPGRLFNGVVHKIRLNATMSQNVVTYVVEISTDNSDGALLPYLTANVKFILSERTDVLAVPNAALRFTPPDEAKIDYNTIPKTSDGERLVWVLRGKTPTPVVVSVGLSDGSYTEITSGEIQVGDALITGSKIIQAATAADPAEQAKSPFLPTPPKAPGTKK